MLLFDHSISLFSFFPETLIYLFLKNSIAATKMVLTREKKHQNKKILSQLNESSKDFVFGNNANENVDNNETVMNHTGGFVRVFERLTAGGNSTRHVQVFEENIADKFEKEVDNACYGRRFTGA